MADEIVAEAYAAKLHRRLQQSQYSALPGGNLYHAAMKTWLAAAAYVGLCGSNSSANEKVARSSMWQITKYIHLIAFGEHRPDGGVFAKWACRRLLA